MNICFGITGSIAAYRAPDLVKDLVGKGHDVRVLLTDSAKELVSERVLSTVSGNPVLSNNPFHEQHKGTDHISIARWADCIVVYAGTANFLARYAHGIADDFLTLQLLAAQCPVIVAPAMNPAMWLHPAVQENYRVLESRGVHFIGPIHGKVTCGEIGVGHISDSSEIADTIASVFAPKNLFLKGKKILISAGPMRSEIDPVRYIQNRSSGQMGLEIAKAASLAGGKVSVLLGPVDGMTQALFENFETFRYTHPQEYGETLERLFPAADIFLSLAAVLDFEVNSSVAKIERENFEKSKDWRFSVKPVPDYVARMAQLKKPDQQVVAFAAESGTDSEILERAKRKLRKKSVTAIIANPVRPGLGPDAVENEFWILKPDREPVHLGPAPKSSLADPLLSELFS